MEQAWKKKQPQEELRLLIQELDQRAQEPEQLLQKSFSSGLPGQAYARKKLIELWIDWARICSKTNRLDQALQVLRKAVELNPTHADAWDNIAFRILESGTDDQKLLSQAETAGEKAVEYAAGTTQEMHHRATLAKVLIKLEKFHEAMPVIVRGLGLPGEEKDRQSLKELQDEVARKLPKAGAEPEK